MPVRLRGHHFLCILTYRGYGYTPAFVANMTDVVAGIGKGRPVTLVEGPDDICRGLTPEDRLVCNHDCARTETRQLDRIAVEEVGRLLGLDFRGPLEISPPMIDRLRSEFAAGSIRGACARCPWAEFCTGIAAEGFTNTKLFPPEA